MSRIRRFWNVFRPGRVHRDLERELAFHVAERAEEFRAGGLGLEEARRQARLQFGNFAFQLERTRAMDINTSLEAMVRNLRHGARALAKTPAFTITVILTLTLAIGANSAVFSVIDAVLLRPLPFPRADRLVKLVQSQPHIATLGVAPVRLEDWNRLNDTFEGITGYYTEDVSETSGEIPEKLKRARLAPRFLQVLGISPVLGRDFTPQEEHYGGPPAVMISYRLWQRRFAGNPGAIGKRLRFAEAAFTIVGILPASFRFPDREVDVWWMLAPDAPYAQDRESAFFTAIGRLKPDVTLAQARQNLAAVQASLGQQYPKTDAVKTVSLDPLKEATVGGVRKSLWLLFASVSLLLLIACTNIAALLLSRAAARQHETSVRFSLGASRGSVAAQVLIEVFILAALGAIAGLLLAAGAASVFRALAKDLPRIEEIGLNGTIVAYSLGCAVLATLLCGIMPVIRGAGASLTATLAQGGRSQTSGRNPVQFVLVAVQVAMAVMLLAGAGLLVRSFQELGRVAPGFDPGSVLAFHVSSTWAEAGGNGARRRTDRILDGLKSVPGIESAATTTSIPGVPSDYQVEMKTTEPRAETEPKMMAQGRWVTPDYFKVLRIPILAGDVCRDDVVTAGAMVNHAFADRYFHGAAAIGRHLVEPANPYLRPAEIRGIVGDARETGLDQEPPPVVYICSSSMQPGTFFLVRTHGDPGSFAGAIRSRVHQIEPLRSIYDLTSLPSRISDAYAEDRLRMILLAFFAVTAIALASLGLYGTLSYAVNIRRREIAVRMALGAIKGQVVRQFLRQGMQVTIAGAVAGLALAAAFARVLATMLYRVSVTDLTTALGVIGIVIAVSAVASLLPAMRAARLDPIEALREE